MCQDARDFRAGFMPAKDLEKKRAYDKAWRAANKDKLRAAQARWREANREKLNAKRRDPEERRKIRARDRVRDRIKRKKWPAPGAFKCGRCEATAECYHHPDYDCWWAIEALCHQCHMDHHHGYTPKVLFQGDGVTN